MVAGAEPIVATRDVGDREARIVGEAVSRRWEEVGVLGSDKVASRGGQGLVLLQEGVTEIRYLGDHPRTFYAPHR